MTGRVVTEQTIFEIWKRGENRLVVSEGAIVTPAARDAAKSRNVQIVVGQQHGTTSAASPAAAAARPTGNVETIVIGADHGGFELKSILVAELQGMGYKVDDLGTFSTEPVDYPDIALSVAQRVSSGACRFGILIDGAGVGSAMVANKLPGVRAACCNDLFTAVNSREHNNANILTLGGRVIGTELAKKIIRTWLNTAFAGGRHQRRVAKIDAVDASYRSGK